MFGTRTRKILREVLSHKARTALVMLNIFIGVLGVVTLTSVSDLMVRTARNDLREDELPMVYMNVTLLDYSNIDNAKTLDTLRAHPGVTIVEGWLADHLFWKFPGDESFIDATILASSEPLGAMKINPARLIDGVYPVTGQQQLAVERRMADRYGLQVGDQVVIRILRNLGSQPDPSAPIPEETWTISGIVFNPYLPNGSSTMYATYDAKEAITGPRGFTFINARFYDFPTASTEFGSFIGRIQDQTPYDSSDEELQDPADSIQLSAIEDTMSALTLLAIVAMVVAGFLVFTVINTLVMQQVRQIGIMKSLGATRWDTFKIYIGIALVYGALGVIPGVLLGIPAGYEVAKVFAGQINVWFNTFTLSAVGILAGVVMGLGIPVLAAIVPVYLGTRVTILDALTDLGISGRYGSGPLARLIKRLPVPVVVRQALANVSQKKGRLALTTFTLMLAAGGFMGVTAVFLDLDKVVNDMFETYNYELVITPERPQDHEPITRLVSSMDGIDRVYPSYSWDAFVPLTSEPGTEYTHLWVIGLDTSTDSMKLHLSEGTAWQDDPAREGVVLTKPRAQELGKQAGDPITLTYEERSLETQVVGIDTNPEEDAYMAWQPLYRLIYPSSEPAPGELWVRLDDRTVSAGDVDKVIGDVRDTLLRNGISAGFFNQVGQEEEISALILAMSLIFNIASVVMALVAGIGLLTMLSISVFERQREIGVMRSVGASSGTIAAQFLVEGLVVGVIGWLVAIPVSYVLSQGFQEVIPWEAFEFSYPPEIILVGLIGTLALATLASLWPALAAARKRVSDILRYQ
jgi:putative ABC transport system permease protein